MRMRALSIGATVAVLVTSFVTLNARQDPRAAIEAANKQFAVAFAKGDAAAIAAMYSSTAQAFPPNGDVVRGREGL